MENPLLLGDNKIDFIVGFMNMAYTPVEIDSRYGKLELYHHSNELIKKESVQDGQTYWDLKAVTTKIDLIEKKFEDESENKKWGAMADVKAGVLTPENLNELQV